MNSDRIALGRIDSMSTPRHLFVIPGWIEPTALDRLMDDGYLTSEHLQRDATGTVTVAMDLQVTTRGKRLLYSERTWKKLALKGSLAGAGFTAMSVAILYLG